MARFIVYSRDGEIQRCVADRLEYNGEFMGACSVNISVTSPTPIDFEVGDYLMYRGERFEINYDPTELKQAAKNTYGESFKYENIVFNSLADELTRCELLDYVKEDNLIHYSSLPTFSFYAEKIDALAERIQVNLDRIYKDGMKWTVSVHPEYINDSSKFISVDKINVWDALSLANSEFGANFIIRGRTITIGTAGIAVGNMFKYGNGNGLYSIQKTADFSQKIITRLRAYGSTKNMPYDYYTIYGDPIIEAPIEDVSYGYDPNTHLIDGAVATLPFDVKFLSDTALYDVTVNGYPYKMKRSNYIGKCYILMDNESDKNNVRIGAKIQIEDGIEKDDIPRKYKKPSGALVPNNMAVKNLMLPDFPEKTLDPYIDSENIGIIGIREGSVFFDGSDSSLPEIYPSMEGMTAQQLIDAGIIVNATGALDEIAEDSVNKDGTAIVDDGHFEEGETIPSFKIYLKDIGFDINDYLTGETATISMKSGMCGGREFEILGDADKPIKQDDMWVLTCNRFYDEGLNLYFPYKDFNIKTGDKFVLLGIDMPDVYIKAASQRLLAASQEYLAKNDYARYTYEPKVDEIFMARHPELHDSIKEGDLMLFEDEDLNINGSIIIDSLTIKEGDGLIPTYNITLRNDKAVGTLEKIQNQIDSIVGGQGGGGGLTTQQVQSIVEAIGSQLFLNKTRPDKTNFLVNFLSGILLGNNGRGILVNNYGEASATIDELNGVRNASIGNIKDISSIISQAFASGPLGSGFMIKVDSQTGRSYIEVDELFVRIKAMFSELEIKKLSYVGGNYMFTAAGMKCGKVEGHEEFWRCYLLVDDGETSVENPFKKGDQIRFQEFNIKPGVYENVSNRYYWRLCVGVGEDYIDLSKTDCDANSDAPQEGDSLVQLGNRTDKKRQNAITLSVYGDDAPSIHQYAGINSYSLGGKEVTVISPQGNKFMGDFILMTGVNIMTQFKILENLIHSEISSVRDEVMSKDNYLYNAAFASNTKGWETVNNIRIFTVNGMFLKINNEFYSRKDAMAAVVLYDNKNVLRIIDSGVKQTNADLADKPVYGEGEPLRKFFISFRYKVAIAGTLTIGFPGQNLHFTERLEPNDEYVIKEYSGTWNGTGDFELKFTGDIYLYSLALTDNAYEDLYTKLSSEIEQTATSIRLEVSELSESNNKKFAEIDLRSDSIELSVSEVEKSVTELGSSTTQRFSAINQRADSIELSVREVEKSVTDLGTSTTERFSSINQTVGSISASVTSIESDVAGINNTIRNAGWITTAEGNNLWASKELENGETIVSKINQTADTIAIAASHIRLEGIVTANSNFKVNLDGSIEAENGKFNGHIYARSIKLGIITEKLTDGAFIDGGEYIAPQLNPNEVALVKWARPLSRLSQHLSIIAENSDVYIQNGIEINMTNNISFDINGTAGEIIGINNGYTTVWFVYKYDVMSV